MRPTSLITLLSTLTLTTASSLPTIYSKGDSFFTSDGKQFFLRGIRYDRSWVRDSLADAEQCRYDAAVMKTLGLNSIRVREVDMSVDHSGCMRAFADVGIYVWVPLSNSTTRLHWDVLDSGAPYWNQTTLLAFENVMDEFVKYDNTGGFFIGQDEVIFSDEDNGATTRLAPYIKAAVRDMKTYREARSYRPIPIGYSDLYVPHSPSTLREYLTCHTTASSSVDFYAVSLTSRQDCQNTISPSSRLKPLMQPINTTIPVFFSQLSDLCSAHFFASYPNRIFGWNGAIVQDWYRPPDAQGEVGLVDYAPPIAGPPLPKSPEEFSALSGNWAENFTPVSSSADDYVPHLTAPTCPARSLGWVVDGGDALPTIPLPSTVLVTVTRGGPGATGVVVSAGFRDVIASGWMIVGLLCLQLVFLGCFR